MEALPLTRNSGQNVRWPLGKIMMPMANQLSKRRHVGHGSADMSASAESAPAGATNQTQGVVNLLGRFGSRMRSTRMPTEHDDER